LNFGGASSFILSRSVIVYVRWSKRSESNERP
jgi:hypothetical protein